MPGYQPNRPFSDSPDPVPNYSPVARVLYSASALVASLIAFLVMFDYWPIGSATKLRWSFVALALILTPWSKVIEGVRWLWNDTVKLAELDRLDITLLFLFRISAIATSVILIPSVWIVRGFELMAATMQPLLVIDAVVFFPWISACRFIAWFMGPPPSHTYCTRCLHRRVRQAPYCGRCGQKYEEVSS